MKFLVMIKQVPDTTMINVDENGNLIRTGVPSILDPYCEYALDMINRIKNNDDSIVAVTMGPLQAKEALLRCLELGADEAYLLSDKTFAGADTYATSRTLAAFVNKIAPDYDHIFCGKQAADGDTAQVPAELSRMLCIPQFYYVEGISRDTTGITVIQNYGDEIRTCKLPNMSMVSVSQGDLNRRLPSMSRYLEAAKKEIQILDRISLGLGIFSVGLKGSKTKIVHSYSPKSEHKCIIFDGTDPSIAAKHILEEIK